MIKDFKPTLTMIINQAFSEGRMEDLKKAFDADLDTIKNETQEEGDRRRAVAMEYMAIIIEYFEGGRQPVTDDEKFYWNLPICIA